MVADDQKQLMQCHHIKPVDKKKKKGGKKHKQNVKSHDRLKNKSRFEWMKNAYSIKTTNFGAK